MIAPGLRRLAVPVCAGARAAARGATVLQRPWTCRVAAGAAIRSPALRAC